MNAWIIDTETAGLQGGVVEFAALAIDADLKVVEEVHSLINPEREITQGAFEIHGISQEMVAGKPTLKEFIGEQQGPLYWIGHNAPFDERMCKGVLTASRSLCTLKGSRQYIKGAENYKLQTLKEFLGLSDQKAHSALGDCYTTHELLKIIVERAGVPLATLFERASTPRMLAVMPWGAHAGKPILQVPRPYRNWLLSVDIDTDLRYTLEKIKDI